jgi:hypothetical protein
VRLPPPTALALALAAAGCGTGLYDADGLPPDDPAGLVCDAGQVVCANVCTTEDVVHCGAGCVECGKAASPPAHGALACLAGACGFECLDGYLKCGDACCPTTALAAGPDFTCALLADGAAGAIRCWGANADGQLGDGTLVGHAAPVAVPLAGAIAVGAGERHACAVLPGGAVACWGANEAGQVTGVTGSSRVAVPAATPVTSGAEAVVGGAAHTCARVGGAVRCWGSNAQGQLGGAPDATGATTPIAAGATDLAAGADHSCAVVAGGVRCWGANGSGQLGDGTTITPPVGTITAPIPSGIARLAASAGQTCAARPASNLVDNVDDVVRCWGDSLGADFLLQSPQPTAAIPMKDDTHSTIRGDDPSLLAVGAHHACYQKAGEALLCFGAADLGQLGGTPLGTGELVQVPLLPVTSPAVSALASGASHGCAALGDGRLRCWGANGEGQLGDGTTADPGPGVIVLPSGR